MHEARALLVVLAVGFFVGACATSGLPQNDYTELRWQAASDFNCPRSEIETARLAGGVYGARGCGQEQDYECRADGMGTFRCVAQGERKTVDADIHPAAAKK